MSQSVPEHHDVGAGIPAHDGDPASLELDVAAIASSSLRLDAFVTAALRTRLWGARRVLAHGLDPSVSFEDLLADVRRAGADRAAVSAPARRSDVVPAESLGAWWRALGRVVALQGLRPEDQTDGLLLHDIARLLSPLSAWPARDAYTYAQLRWAQGQRDLIRRDGELLRALDEEDRSALDVDLAADAAGVASAPWNAAVARMLGPVPAVTVSAGSSTAFDGLKAVSTAEPIDGPLVSVIMSSYRSGPEILTSVRSILDQTWTNLELLVVDDASGPAYTDMLDRVAALDPRVRVLVQPENRGTYGARNRALPETRGDFVTFQDSDDWSHPERIARQVQRLLVDPALPAVMSRSVRCTPDLELQLLGYRASRPNVSSLMLRRSTIDALGFFDHVRKGADSEYERRIAAHFGRRVAVMPELLAFVRLDPDSLSRSDFKPGWWHPARYAYRDGYEHWHRAIAAGADPRLADQGRRFPAPRPFLRGTGDEAEEQRFDYLFAADWREVGASQSVLLQQVRMLARKGLRLGILHLESLRALDTVGDALCLEVRELQAEGAVTRVLPGDAAVVERLVLGDPSLLGHGRTEVTAAEIHAVSVLASAPAYDVASRARRYDPAVVTALITATWGIEPLWIAGDEAVRAELTGASGVQVAPATLGGTYDAAAVAPRAHRRTAPVIGATVGASEDVVLGTAAGMLHLFPGDGRYDVRVIAARTRLGRLMGHTPPSWLVFTPGDLTAQDLYGQLDFFVSTTGSDRVDQVIPRVIDAVSAGTVPIVPPSFEDVLGEAAVYATDAEVAALAARLFVDPAEYAATVARGREWIRSRFSRTIDDTAFSTAASANGDDR